MDLRNPGPTQPNAVEAVMNAKAHTTLDRSSGKSSDRRRPRSPPAASSWRCRDRGDAADRSGGEPQRRSRPAFRRRHFATVYYTVTVTNNGYSDAAGPLRAPGVGSGRRAGERDHDGEMRASKCPSFSAIGGPRKWAGSRPLPGLAAAAGESRPPGLPNILFHGMFCPSPRCNGLIAHQRPRKDRSPRSGGRPGSDVFGTYRPWPWLMAWNDNCEAALHD